jgi:hypothetical protein
VVEKAAELAGSQSPDRGTFGRLLDEGGEERSQPEAEADALADVEEEEEGRRRPEGPRLHQ